MGKQHKYTFRVDTRGINDYKAVEMLRFVLKETTEQEPVLTLTAPERDNILAANYLSDIELAPSALKVIGMLGWQMEYSSL